jgi:hypothetical protein
MKKRKAVFTIVKNEAVMLPLWLSYYSKHFDGEDIYILDHQTTDGSTDQLPCNKRIIRSDSAFDHPWLNRVVRNYQIELLTKYRQVLFVEADEMIYHPAGLGRYIDSFEGASVKCNGFELQHVPDSEPQIDLTSPILLQRSHWWHNPEYCKTLIASHPINWGLGFHNAENPGPFNKDLYLIHLHRFDYGLAYQKNEQRSRMKWSKDDMAKGRGFQNRILGEQFNKWFSNYQGNVLVSIPDDVKNSGAF